MSEYDKSIALFETHKQGIIDLRKERPTTKEEHWGMTVQEYLDSRGVDLKAHFGIEFKDISHGLGKSKSWFSLAKSKPTEKTRPINISYEVAAQLEILTYGYISRQYSMPRAIVQEMLDYGIIFQDLKDRY